MRSFGTADAPACRRRSCTGSGCAYHTEPVPDLQWSFSGEFEGPFSPLADNWPTGWRVASAVSGVRKGLPISRRNMGVLPPASAMRSYASPRVLRVRLISLLRFLALSLLSLEAAVATVARRRFGAARALSTNAKNRSSASCRLSAWDRNRAARSTSTPSWVTRRPPRRRSLVFASAPSAEDCGMSKRSWRAVLTLLTF